MSPPDDPTLSSHRPRPRDPLEDLAPLRQALENAVKCEASLKPEYRKDMVDKILT